MHGLGRGFFIPWRTGEIIKYKKTSKSYMAERGGELWRPLLGVWVLTACWVGARNVYYHWWAETRWM